MDNLLPSGARRSIKLQERLKLDEPKVVKNLDYTSTASSGNHHERQTGRITIEKEELVKYMSKLPSYLQKGENIREKALNVGVLDWRRLEKWQYNHKTIVSQSSRCSPSSSNASSFFSTDGSSARSSRGHSCSPVRQGMRRPTLQAHLNASPNEGYSPGVNTIAENIGKFEDLKAAFRSNPLKGRESVFRKSFSRNQSEIKLKECKRKETEPQIIPEIETSLGFKSFGAASQSKGKTIIQHDEYTSELEELQEPSCGVHHNYHERQKNAILPGDDPQSSHTAISTPCDLATVNGQGSTEASQRSFSGQFFHKELHKADQYSDIAHSCPLPCEELNIKDSRTKQRSSIDAKSIKFSSELSQPSPCSVKMSMSSPRGKNLEEKLKVLPTNSTASKSSEGSELRKGTVDASKFRNRSPTRRFSIGLGWIVRTSGSKDTSEHVKTKRGPEKTVASSSVEDSSNGKSNGTNRSQSSPLRRLIDPFLKSKAASSHQCSDPLEKNPTGANRACTSSSGHVESSTAHSVKMKLDLTSCKTISVDDSHQNKKQRSSTVQALLQITMKNGLPLFTFAVDNISDILAATMKKISDSRKDDSSWIYTFFTFREVKKKNGWINQAGKGEGHGYVPNVIGQMAVSSSQSSNLGRLNSTNEFGIREFVLFGVDLRQANGHELDIQTNDELAAIVVRLPKETPRCSNKDKQQSGYCNDPRKNEEDGSPVRNQDHLCTTVILPSGVHGLPSKGEPSPLIERWKSGGLCDCGGWDLGCELRVLTNQDKLSRRSNSSKAHHPAERFELFSQV